MEADEVLNGRHWCMAVDASADQHVFCLRRLDPGCGGCPLALRMEPESEPRPDSGRDGGR